PPWPTQATVPMTCRDLKVDAWLSEPIAWDLGAPPDGIPMARALALLWELRQDVHLHFPNQTRTGILTYLAWCLTQGIRDKCVAADLIGPDLADFLDTPDPELAEDLSADEPPLTRLLRIIVPLYDGLYPDIVRQFPATRQARLSVAIWACGAM